MTDHLYLPFLDATRSVFEMMLDLSDIQDLPADQFSPADELDIAIGVIGDLTGEVVYRFPQTTSLQIVNIMSGMEMDSVDDFVTSAISEIANIISGNVLTLLSQQQLNCDILPPAPAQPDIGRTYDLQKTCCICTSAGDVCLDIRLNFAKAA